MNPRTWVLKASTLPLDHRSKLFVVFLCDACSLLCHHRQLLAFRCCVTKDLLKRQDPVGSNGRSVATNLLVSTLGTRAFYLHAPYTFHRSTLNTENNFTTSADNNACNILQIHFNIIPLLPVEIKFDSALPASHGTLAFLSRRGTPRLFLAFPCRTP